MAGCRTETPLMLVSLRPKPRLRLIESIVRRFATVPRPTRSYTRLRVSVEVKVPRRSYVLFTRGAPIEAPRLPGVCVGFPKGTDSYKIGVSMHDLEAQIAEDSHSCTTIIIMSPFFVYGWVRVFLNCLHGSRIKNQPDWKLADRRKSPPGCFPHLLRRPPWLSRERRGGSGDRESRHSSYWLFGSSSVHTVVV